MVSQQLCEEVQSLLTDNDIDSLEYLLSGVSKDDIEALAASLSEEEALKLRSLKLKDANESSKPSYVDEVRAKQAALLETTNSFESEDIFQKMKPLIEPRKLEVNGYPFYWVVKMVLIGYGVLEPSDPMIRMMHSQVTTLIFTLFCDPLLKYLNSQARAYQQELKSVLAAVFVEEVRKYQEFKKVINGIKRQFGDTISDSDQEEPPVNVQHHQSDEDAEYFSQLTSRMTESELFEYNRCRTVNFMAHGMEAFIELLNSQCPIMAKLARPRAIVEVCSFIFCRFIRKTVFQCIRSLKGKLKVLGDEGNALPELFRTKGNEIIQSHRVLLSSILQEQEDPSIVAERLFMAQFDAFGHRQFLPTHLLGRSCLEIWSASKDYRRLWTDRVKAEASVKAKINRQKIKGRPPVYYEYIYRHMDKFKSSPEALWNEYVAAKFGAASEGEPTKRTKFQPLNN